MSCCDNPFSKSYKIKLSKKDGDLFDKIGLPKLTISLDGLELGVDETNSYIEVGAGIKID